MDHKGGQVLLRELGIRKTVFEPQFTGPERTVFTDKLEKMLTQQEPQGCYRALAASVLRWVKTFIK